MTPEACGVEAEDLAVLAEGDDALLDARAARVEHADDRHAGLEGELHDLDDLLAGDLAERAAEDREVLRVDGDLAAVDGAGAGDDRVAVRPLLLHAERVGAVAHELVELDERALVEQLLDALAGGLLALGVLLLDRGLAARGHGLVVAHLEIGELAGGRVRSGHGRGAERGVGGHARSAYRHPPGGGVVAERQLRGRRLGPGRVAAGVGGAARSPRR